MSTAQARLTTFEKMRAEALRHVEAKTSREQESVPLDVDILKKLTVNTDSKGDNVSGRLFHVQEHVAKDIGLLDRA